MFLDCGYTPDLFYQMSINEVIDLIESHNRVRQERQKTVCRSAIAILDSFGGNLIEKVLMTFGRARPEEGLHYSLIEYFPELFSQDNGQEGKDAAETEKGKLSTEMQLYKMQRLQHAYLVNRERHK